MLDDCLVDPDARLTPLAEAIADGRAIDWVAIESSASEGELTLIDGLRTVARIAQLHGVAASVETHLVSGRPSPRLLPAHSRWGALEVLEHLGSGRFGDVYRAFDPALHRDVALKLLRARPGADGDDSIAIHEGRLMARVRHPNVVTVHGAQRIDGCTGIWMELVHGQTLEAELKAGGPLPPEAVAAVGIELCRALAAVHGAGLVHRDVKAQNVLREASTGRIVLGDFGTGRELDHMDAERGIAGTPACLAPELFGRASATPRSDLYSAGALLFHLATGGYPVAGRTLHDVRRSHTARQRVLLRESRPDLPEALSRAIDLALSPDPADRFQTADDMLAALEATLQPASTVRTRRTVGVYAVVSLLIAAFAAGTLLFTSGTWFGRVSTTPVLSTPAAAVSAASAPAPRTPIELSPAATSSASGPADMTDGAVMSGPTPPAALLGMGDTILVADVENATGESQLDDTVTYALRYDLRSSPYFRVASPERVRDALAEPKIDAPTRLHGEMGRELARRDGELRAVVASKVERDRDGYALVSEVIGPRDSSIRTTLRSHASTPGELLVAIRDHAFGLRVSLGEPADAAAERRQRLRPALTTSMRALQLLQEADAEIGLDRISELNSSRSGAARLSASEPVLREAVREDELLEPALLRLAYVLRGLKRPPSEYVPFVERARALAGPSPSSAEGHLTLAMAAHFAFEMDGPRIENFTVEVPPERREALQVAARAYESALVIDPELHLAARMAYVVASASQYALNHLQLRRAAADARPLDYLLNASAAWALLREGRPEAGRRYARRALRGTFPPLLGSGVFLRGGGRATIRTFDAWAALLDGDAPSATRHADRLSAELADLPQHERRDVQNQLWHIYMALGKLARADQVNPDPLFQGFVLARRGDFPGLRQHITATWSDPLDRPAQVMEWPMDRLWRMVLLVQAGAIDEAEKERASLPISFRTARPGTPTMWAPSFADGMLLLARGAAADAVQPLEAAWTDISSTQVIPEDISVQLMFPAVCEQLAIALGATGQLERADAVLRQGLAYRPAPAAQYAVLPPSVYGLPRLHNLRIRLLLQQGLESEPLWAGNTLARLLAGADSDDTMLQSMRRIWAEQSSAIGAPSAVPGRAER